MLDEALRKLPKGWHLNPNVTLWQEPDSCGLDESQELEISTSDAGAGPFLVLKTERWALNGEDIDALHDLLKAILAHADAAFETEEGDDA